MSLKPGDKLGPYQITALIGAGGMGEVYRAHDPRLQRDVAIKTSREQFSDRFLREARAVAALNHPNICTLYDVGPNYLVMEYIEGAAPQGPLPVETILGYARQMTAALDAAHEKGVVHRDLKPANLRVTSEGVLKVLDFGLARMGPAGAPDLADSNSPTILQEATQAGVILGTASYMSPEQARGKAVDKRADIWAFGVVLYELATGDRLFRGETISDTLAQVLVTEPDLSRVPARLLPLIRWCLERDLKKRLRDVGDALPLIDAAPVAAQAAKKASRLWPAIAAAGLAAAAVFGYLYLRPRVTVKPESIQLRLTLPEGVSFTSSGSFTVSPDGRRVAFSAIGPGGRGVWIQPLNGEVARLLPGTLTGPEPPPFFWSPDSRYVAFSSEGERIRRVDIESGGVQDICIKPGPPVGGTWSRDGVIIFGSVNAGLWRVPASGGKPVPLTTLAQDRNETQHELPVFLPDGQHLIYFVNSSTAENRGIYVRSLQDPPAQAGRKVVATELGAQLMPPAGDQPARLFYVRDGILLVQEFDLGNLEVRGTPATLEARVGSVYQTPYIGVSDSTLVYRSSADNQTAEMVWLDLATDKTSAPIGEPGIINHLAISPDQNRVAYSRRAKATDNPDIWVTDLVRGSSSRLTFGSAPAGYPVWSADGSEILFASSPEGRVQIFRKRVNAVGDEKLLFPLPLNTRPLDWSPDGKFVLYSSSRTFSFSVDQIFVAPVEGGASIAITDSRFNAGMAHFSPDGKWIVYGSGETGRSEIYLRSFSAAAPAEGRKVMISLDGGTAPYWRADGREIRWMTPGAWYGVDIDTTGGLKVGIPHRISIRQSTSTVTAGTIAKDFKRTLLARTVGRPGSAAETPYFNVMVNWSSALKPALGQ